MFPENCKTDSQVCKCEEGERVKENIGGRFL